MLTLIWISVTVVVLAVQVNWPLGVAMACGFLITLILDHLFVYSLELIDGDNA